MYKYLSDSNLKEINESLSWHSGVELPDGRILGSLTKSKRKDPEPIPDYRVQKLNETLDLAGRSVLELGCFEGAHTLSLLKYTDNVTAVDIRPQNVINTLTRLSVFGETAKVFVCNVEDIDKDFEEGYFDVIFHCGVLYHLKNPVEHLLKLKTMCSYMVLDTHIADDDSQTTKHEDHEGYFFGEGGWESPFAGKDDVAFWLTEDALKDVLQKANYDIEEEWEKRKERNGTRISWLLRNKNIVSGHMKSLHKRAYH